MSEDRHSWPTSSRRRSSNVKPNSVVSEFTHRRTGVDYVEDLEIIQHLKNRRSRALASLTRKKNQIEPLLTADDLENWSTVDTKMEEYLAVFDKFCGVHDTYDNAIQDSEAKTESFMYFVDVKKRYLEFCQKVSLWASSCATHINPDDSASQSTSSGSERSKTSSVSNEESRSARIAELEARRASIQRRKELHERELRLKEEKLKLEIERENIEVEEELNSLKVKEETASRRSSHVTFKPKPKSTSKSDRKLAVQTPSEIFNHSHQSQVVDQQNKIWNEILQQQQRATLPKQQVPTFNGDPLDYHSFVRAFDTLIASREPDFSSKLYYLEQYTSGRPQQLVKSCHYMKPEEGYNKARELLEQRFGEKYRIAMAHVEKLLSVQSIKPEDADALEQYSISLTSCKNALQGVGYLNKIETPDVMRKIIEKLPYKFQDRWRDIADNIINVKHREVTIDDIASFVEQKVRCMSNPIFGKLSSNTRQRTETPPKYRFNSSSQKIVFASQVKDSVFPENRSPPNSSIKKACYVCDGDHSVVSCPIFKEKTYKERMDLASKNRLCFSCLRKGHQSVSCFTKKPCNECNRKHNTLLHSAEKADISTISASTAGPSSSASTAGPSSSASTAGPRSFACSITNAVDKTRSSSTVLPIVPIKVRKQDDNTFIQTYALLDTGSNASFCSESLIKLLGVNSKKTKIKLTTIGESDDVESKVIHGLEVSDLDDNASIKLPAVFSRPVIPVSKDEIPSQADVDSWPQFSDNLQLQFIDSDVDLLIGMDVPEALQPMEIITTTGDGPYATKVKLGWVINGPTGRNRKSVPPNSFKVSMQCLECADFLETDTYSVSKEYTRNESKFMERVEESIHHLQDGHYEVSLPLKDQSVSLPNNRVQAERRSANLKNKLLNNPNFRQDYMGFMKDMIDKGYARKVPQEQLAGIKGKIWYIPHHGVYHKKKPGKIRIVFDCSCKYQGVALNDVLLQGPDLTNNLLGVLLRFRQESVALMADIEGMFLQVRVPDPERNLLRFLWWTDGKLDQDPDEYQMIVHLFGAVSSPSCANFTLRYNAAANKALYQEDVISTVFKNFYVDDCLKSLPSDEKAIHFINDICRLMKDGGFRLTKWISSNREVLQSIPECERAKEVKELDFAKENLPAERALGVTWLVESDSFSFKTAHKECPFTRRGLLSMISSVYDPLGMAVPFTLTAKIILQDLTRLKLKWDEKIPDQFSSPWQKWLYELPQLGDFSLDRCIGPSNQGQGCTEFELHHFADASQKAYGTVSYLRTVNTDSNSDDTVHSSLIMAKSRLAPLKSQSIPRLELAATALSVKSDRMLRTELEIPIQSSSFWTDSTTVIKYIVNESRKFHTYVANRVAQIRSSSSPNQWNYVETKMNPADACTRGMPIDTFLSYENWKTGPEFLKKRNIEMPSCPSDVCSTLEEDPEVKKEKVNCAVIVSEDPLEAIFRRFSSFLRLKKFIALCLRLQRSFIARKSNCQVKDFPLISVGELRRAEHEILRHVQKQAFPQELTELTKGANIKKTSQILKLDPILTDDLLRVGGRLRKSSLSYDFKHQVIIPKNSCIAPLMIKEAHQLSGHSGREYVLSMTRQRYWIVHANAMTRKVLSSCFECKRRQAW